MKQILKSVFEQADLRKNMVRPTVSMFHLGVNREKRETEIVLSLTSHPGRINTAYLTIATLLNQSYKPDHIVLWLAKEQFPYKENGLPSKLLKMKKNGLEIKWYKDIRPYKKLIPSLKEYPDSVIITVDDDWYYRIDLIERLIQEHKKHPNEIISNKITHPLFDMEGKLIGRKKQEELTGSSSYLNKLVGSDGVLYPPHSLDLEVFSEEFMEIAPTNDDIWFWAMAVKNGTKIYCPQKPNSPYMMTDAESQSKTSLERYNSNNDMYMVCMKRIFERYPEVLHKVLIET